MRTTPHTTPRVLRRSPTRRRRSAIAIAGATALALLLSCLAAGGCGSGSGGGHGAGSGPTVMVGDEAFPRRSVGKIAMLINPTESDVNAASLDAALGIGRRAGVQVVNTGYLGWADLEPVIGTYLWEEFDLYFARLAAMGNPFEVALDAGHIIHPGGSLRLPDGLAIAPFHFDSPALVSRYTAFITALLQRYGSRIRYFTIRSEGAAPYFAEHPDELPRYQALLRAVFASARTSAPGVLFGTSGSQEEGDAILRALNTDTDYCVFQVWQHDALDAVNQVEPVVDHLVAIAGAKRIAIELSWPASSAVGSSPQQQAEIVREAVRLLAKHRSACEYLSYVQIHDESTALLQAVFAAAFPDMTPEWRARLLAWYTSLGLRDSHGTARPAWNAWHDAVLRYYRGTTAG